MSETHNPIPVAGYKPQSQAVIDVVNRIKGKEAESMQIIDWFQMSDEIVDADIRCLSVARTNIQTGFMWLYRAILQPGNVPSDFDVIAFVRGEQS